MDTTVTNIINYAVEVFGNAASAREWMHTPLIALGGKTPLEFLATEEGARGRFWPNRARHFA